MRVFFSNLGCKLNQAELESLARRFVAAGHAIAPSLAEAELHVVNTCTVTHLAARDSRKLARRGRRLDPGLRTVLTGCYATAEAAAAAALEGVDLVVPNEEKERLLDRVHEAFPEALPAPPGGEGPVPVPHLPVPYVPLEFGNARALVKAEDGCNMRCAFCIIPLTRGRQRSRRLPEVVAEVRALAAGGFAEVVVTGVQISAYRWRGAGLFELVAALLDQTPVRRLRLTSIAPWQFDRRLLGLFAGGRLCRHFHFSLQSGADAVLRRMRRPYARRQYAALLDEVRRAVPGVAITTDLIVGFPGETEAEFEDGLAFVEEMAFAKVHAFPYSPREGTEAAAMPGQVPPPVRRERMDRALQVARTAEHDFARSQLGATLEVLWERRSRDRWLGTTDNYLRVWVGADEDLAGRLTPARLIAFGADGVRTRLAFDAAAAGDRAAEPGSRPVSDSAAAGLAGRR